MHADVSWRSRAACRGMDVNLFHPGEGKTRKAVLDTCRGCPVRLECLEEARRCETPWEGRQGIWGGLTPGQRRRLFDGKTRAFEEN